MKRRGSPDYTIFAFYSEHFNERAGRVIPWGMMCMSTWHIGTSSMEMEVNAFLSRRDIAFIEVVHHNENDRLQVIPGIGGPQA